MEGEVSRHFAEKSSPPRGQALQVPNLGVAAFDDRPRPDLCLEQLNQKTATGVGALVEQLEDQATGVFVEPRLSTTRTASPACAPVTRETSEPKIQGCPEAMR